MAWETLAFSDSFSEWAPSSASPIPTSWFLDWKKREAEVCYFWQVLSTQIYAHLRD